MMVSVIIPNYNHAPYLPQRIESVLQQTIKDLEVLILDDCSTDNSLDILKDYAESDPRIRLILNESNSGSTFKQWNKGFKEAKGKYVWIAESDDYADVHFLEKLLAPMEADNTIGLAYCHSWSIDGESNITHGPEHIYATVDPKRWADSFIVPGIELVKRYMSFSCIIPNASAAVFRNDVMCKVGPADESMRLAGDWLFWAKMLAATNIAFIAEPLNYFRYHGHNVRSTAIVSGLGLEEEARVLNAMKIYGEPDPHFVQKKIDSILQRWFYTMVNYSVPLDRHRSIYHLMSSANDNFKAQFYKEFSKFLFGNKLSGVRQFIGDKWIPKLKTAFNNNH